MIDAVFAIPGDLATPTGGYAYARRILPLLPAFGVQARHLPLPGSFPAPAPADISETARLIAAVPDDSPLLIDGLAYGAFPGGLLAKIRQPIVALVHHPLCLEAGLSETRARELRSSETAALARADRVIAVSPAMTRILAADFAVPESRIMIASPGTDPAPRATGCGNPVRLLAVGAVTPRKGFDVLIEALAHTPSRSWQLTIAGALDRNRDAAAGLRDRITEAGLADRVTLAGAVSDDALENLYASADVFVMSSHFEGYGMVLAEAMARGIAIVCTTGGAAAETVPDAAACKVAPCDAVALRAALTRLIADPKLRASLAEASWSARQTLPRWEDTARQVASALHEVAK